jgi:hypothetical protein
MIRTILLFSLAAMMLSACGDLPRPFEGAGREGNPELLELHDTGSVRVEAPDGIPDGAAEHLARAMASALRDQDIPAFSDSDTGGTYVVKPNVIAHLDGGDQARLDMTWVLYNDKMLAIDSMQSTGKIGSKAWFAGVPQGPEEPPLNVPREVAKKIRKLNGEKADPIDLAYGGLVADAAQRIAGRILGDRNSLQQAKLMQVALFDFEGAPGDGNVALQRSAGAFLKSKGIAVGTEIDDRTVVLSATISVTPVTEKTTQKLDRVKIDWVILDNKGKQLGQMGQNNIVPRGRLDKHWGAVASLAAQAAVDALEGALGQIARDRGLLLREKSRRTGATG